ncbi:hypothetical protein F4818DRAFT_416294 [Hypoxylon cercidicola]|nr:hypothetical protein F4818DRAFT_416294 [Hypoxylon cercidicola]
MPLTIRCTSQEDIYKCILPCMLFQADTTGLFFSVLFFFRTRKGLYPSAQVLPLRLFFSNLTNGAILCTLGVLRSQTKHLLPAMLYSSSRSLISTPML